MAANLCVVAFVQKSENIMNNPVGFRPYGVISSTIPNLENDLSVQGWVAESLITL